MGGRGIGGDVIKSVGLMRGVKNPKVILKLTPGLKKGRGGKGRGRGGGVIKAFNKIEIPADKRVDVVGESEEGGDEGPIERMVP